MRHEPYESELRAVPTMSDGELLDYFILRIFETDEVWGLNEGAGWLVREHEGKMYLPLFPYRRFARDAALDFLNDGSPISVALEHFIDHSLHELIETDTMLEILPRDTAKLGCVISPHRLFDILIGLFDSAEYRLDG
ncbi:MAG: DUF2750 domain-containing protein [Spongiibacteraceae bacterium]